MKRILNPLIGAFIGSCIAWFLVPRFEALIHLSIPVDRWFEVGSVLVADAKAGVPNQVVVSRAIHRPFTAAWTVTLVRRTDGGLTRFCSRTGEYDYRPGTVLPPVTDIDWWMNVPVNRPCGRLPPGRYVLQIVWRVNLPGLPSKEVRVQSNEFRVLP